MLLFYSFLSVIYIHFFIYESDECIFAQCFHILTKRITLPFKTLPNFTLIQLLNINVWCAVLFFILYYSRWLSSREWYATKTQKKSASFKCIIQSVVVLLVDFNHNSFNRTGKKPSCTQSLWLLIDTNHQIVPNFEARKSIYLFHSSLLSWLRVD